MTKRIAPVSLAFAIALAACGAGKTSSAPPDSSERARAEGRSLTSKDIDDALREQWKREGVAPAPLADDATFLRRAWLDVAGVVPPPNEVESFLADASPKKREALIARLVASPLAANRWANRWETWLLGAETKTGHVDRDAFRGWVTRAFSKNEPYDRFAYELVTATGTNTGGGASENGAVNWILRFRDAPEDLAGTASRVLLGVQIQCAQCHDHKTEKWKQADFRGFAACFMRLSGKPTDDDNAMGGMREFELRDVERPSFVGAGKKKLEGNPYAGAAPRALDGTDLSAAPNRRQALARWMVDPKNPWFAKAFVNRVWAELMGRGFVDPVDDIRPSNPAVAPELFERITRDFVAHRFDVRRLVSVVAGTDAYRLASTGAGDTFKLWSRHPLRPMGSDALLDSVIAATGIEPVLERVAGDNLDKLRADLRRQVSFMFEVDDRASASTFEGTVSQALWLRNGKLVNGGASALPGTAMDALLAKKASDAETVKALFLRTLSRPPSAEELAYFVKFVNEPRAVASDEGPAEMPPPPQGKRRDLTRAAEANERKLTRAERLLPRRATPKEQAFEDVLWALLNSSEFYFDH